MALSYTKLSVLYKISEGGYFVHSYCISGNYIYALLCDQSGSGNMFVAKVDKDTLVLQACRKITRTATSIWSQSIRTDGTYLYVACKTTVLTLNSLEVLRISLSDLSTTVVAMQNIYTGSTRLDVGVQEMCLGNDKNSSPVPCLFIPFGNGNADNMRVVKYKCDSNAFSNIPTSLIQQNGGTDSFIWRGPANTFIMNSMLNGDYLYCAGMQVVDSKTRVMVMRIKQELVSGFSDLTSYSQVFVTTANHSASIYDAGAIEMSISGNDLWVAGTLRQQNTSGEDNGYDNAKSDGLLFKVDISGTNLSIPSSNSVYRIRRSDFSRFKLATLTQDTNYLYVSSFNYPHWVLGDSDYNQAMQLNVLKIQKSDMSIVWSRQLSDPSTTAKITSSRSYGSVPGDDLLLSGWTNIQIGDASKYGGLLALVDIASNSNPDTLYDAGAYFKEQKVTTVSITNVSADNNWLKTSATGTMTKDTANELQLPANDTAWTNASSSWSNTIYDLDTTTLAINILPNGDVTGKVNLSCIGNHWDALNDDNGDTSYVSRQTSGWTYDLCTHAAVSDPGGRVTKVEIIQSSAQTAANRTGVAYSFDGGTNVSTSNPSDSNTSGYHSVTIDITSAKSPWTWTDVNNMSFGPYLNAAAFNWTKCSYCYVRVTWEPYNLWALTGHGVVNTTTSNAPLVVGRELSAVAASVVTTATLPLSLLWPLTSAPALVSSTSTPAFTVGRELSAAAGTVSATSTAPLAVNREISAASASVTTTATIPLVVQRGLTAASSSVTATSSVTMNYLIYLTSNLNAISSTSTPSLFFNLPLTAVSALVSNTVSPALHLDRELTAVSGTVLATKAIELLIAGDKSLSALSAIVTSTPAITLIVQRELGSVIASVSNTGGSLSIGRDLAATVGSTSSTSNTVNLEIANAIQLTAAASTVLATSTVPLAIGRELSAVSATANLTLSVPLTVGRELVAAVGIQSFASNFVYLETGGTICALTAASNLTVTTATITALVDRMILSACAIASQTSNTVVLMANKELQANAIMSSWTSPVSLNTEKVFNSVCAMATSTANITTSLDLYLIAQLYMSTRTSSISLEGPSRWYETFTPLAKEYTTGVVLRKTTEREWRDA